MDDYPIIKELDPPIADFFEQPRTPSPVLATNNGCCDLEDILNDAIADTWQGSGRFTASQLITQELTIRPEANIQAEVPEGLDLSDVIDETEEAPQQENKIVLEDKIQNQVKTARRKGESNLRVVKTKENTSNQFDSELKKFVVIKSKVNYEAEKLFQIRAESEDNTDLIETELEKACASCDETDNQSCLDSLHQEVNVTAVVETKPKFNNTESLSRLDSECQEPNVSCGQIEDKSVNQLQTVNVNERKITDIEDTSLNQPDIAPEKSSRTIATINGTILNQLETKPKIMVDVSSAEIEQNTLNQESYRLVGGSKFYQMEGASAVAGTPSPTEKQDDMKPESDDEVSDVDQECTVFDGVSYLGAQNIGDPKSESEIQRIMKELSSMPENKDGIAVSISVPMCSQGMVVLYQADTSSVMTRYAVKRISFYARGTAGSPVASCFAFTWSHGETKESAVYRCHVFRCHIAEAVSQVSSCFAKAFERIPPSMASSIVGELSAAPSMTGSLTEAPAPPVPNMNLMHVLECTLEIKEADAKGSYNHVPKERLGFKLRGGIDKQVTINVKQVTNNVRSETDDPQSYSGGLFIERCFGILLAPGRSVKHSDMRLLEMVSGSSGGSGCSVCAIWNAGESALSAFNVASGEGAPADMSLALDLVIRGIPDPLRLVIETPVKIYPPTERFWLFTSSRPLVQQFYITLKETSDALGQLQYEVTNVEATNELDRSRLNLPLSLSSLLPSPLSTAPPPPSPSEPDSDGDEPLLSGTGEVSKDCGEEVLENWAQVLRSWVGPRPRALNHLVRVGVPEALRGEVWLRLAEVDQNDELMDTYRTLISKECSFEAVIQRDIARTFPAHDFFREAGGLGQDSLLRLARAYAVYDHEVGYCQGLSFVAATLLLHMPEEQAFCLLVRLMYGYGLRELYKDGFEALYMRLHQLDRLMEEQLSDLRAHFQKLGVEPHMFASQWFLTVFTARFPLPLVYHILDVFLLQGIDTLFQVAIALLTRARKELLQNEFEGVLKYFRVTLPKKCRAEENSRQIVKMACSVKVKRLHKYQLEYEKFIKEAAEAEKRNVELERLKTINSQLMQEKEALEAQLEEAVQSTLEAKKEATHYAAVGRDYRDICARLDKQVHQMQDCVNECVSCSGKLSQKDNKQESEAKEAENGEGASDSEALLRQRVRDLELELAQVKLEHVEAQCSNQELTHQLNAALNEIHTVMSQKQSSVAPWLMRTLNSIMDATQTKSSFQTYISSNEPQSPSNTSHTKATLDRRVSEPYSPDVVRRKKAINTKRHSLLLEANVPKEAKDNKRRSHHDTSVKNLSMG